MNRNLSPKQISFLFASILTLILYFLIPYIHNDNSNRFLLVIGFFVFTFLLLLVLFNYFIYGKIKLIYKNIHSLQTKKENLETLKLNVQDPFKQINKEVENWANEKTEELEQLKLAEKYRREFLSNVSHELKTPLFSIQGFINTVLDGDLDDKELITYFLTKASKNADRLQVLVEDLESISKLESGILHFEHETFNIQDQILDIFSSLEFMAQEKNIELKFKSGSNKPMFVEADKAKIAQVLTNLIVNSIKYGNENGKTEIGLYDLDENVMVEIKDNGVGIAKEHLPRLFERFYRVDKSRTREEGGTGLGLAIVKHIIEAHQQTINVTSELNKGTTFSFTLKKA